MKHTQYLLKIACIFVACIFVGCGDISTNVEITSEVKTSLIERPLRIPSITEEPQSPRPPDAPPFESSELPLTSFWVRALEKSQAVPYLQSLVTRRRVHMKGTNLEHRIELAFADDMPTTTMQLVSQALDLPEMRKALSGQTVKWKNRKWRVHKEDDTDRQILEWEKQPSFSPPPLKRCYRPHHLDGAALLNGGIGRTFKRTTTKRILESESRLSLTSSTTSILIWYKNGFAQDEHIGHLQDALKKSRWTKDDGVSVKQSWSNGDAESLSWRPVRETFRMNCKLRGAFIRFSWSRRR